VRTASVETNIGDMSDRNVVDRLRDVGDSVSKKVGPEVWSYPRDDYEVAFGIALIQPRWADKAMHGTLTASHAGEDVVGTGQLLVEERNQIRGSRKRSTNISLGCQNWEFAWWYTDIEIEKHFRLTGRQLSRITVLEFDD
jgi:hypothetical protein